MQTMILSGSSVRSLALAALLLLPPMAARAAVLPVTSTDDAGPGSLRQAILDSNTSAGVLDTITFNIPGGGVLTIAPVSALPTITDPVVIDGYTQPGAMANTNGPGLGNNAALKIELNGAGAGDFVSGLTINAGNSTVRGLVINRFSVGVLLQNNGGDLIAGNFIGTDATGTVDRGNTAHGIVSSTSNTNRILRQ